VIQQESFRKPVLVLVSRQIIAGQLEKSFFASCIAEKHAVVIEKFYASAILLGCSLLSHRDYACSEAGQNLIVSLFSVLPDIQKRREILSNLLERIEDQSSLGSTAVLQVLRAIGARHPSSLYPFKTILDQLIDYMEFFSTNDIRILYQFMCLVHLSDVRFPEES